MVVHTCPVESHSLRLHRLNIACQALLSIELFRQEYWNGLPFPTSGDLPDPGIEPMSLSSALAGRFFTTVPSGTSQTGRKEDILMKFWILSHKIKNAQKVVFFFLIFFCVNPVWHLNYHSVQLMKCRILASSFFPTPPSSVVSCSKKNISCQEYGEAYAHLSIHAAEVLFVALHMVLLPLC